MYEWNPITNTVLTFPHFKLQPKTYLLDYVQCLGIFNDFALYQLFYSIFLILSI